MASTPRWHRALLPGDLRDDPDGRSPRDWIVDAIMVLVAIGVGMVVFADSESAHSEGMAFLDVILGVVALIALWWRRRYPAAVGVFTASLSIVSAFAGGPALIAGFNVALRGSRRGILATVGATVVSIFVFAAIYPAEEDYLLSVFIGFLITAVVIGWGLFARARREQVLELRDRAVRLEAEHQLRIDQARDAERRRIAREMHDVLAHRVSLLSLHAGALEYRADASPEEVAEAAGVIRAAARDALEELRQVIGVLREGDGGTPERPQPTLADIPELIEESVAAGMRLRCAIDVPEDRVPSAALGRTAYRIVQEGLTNARKHAPAAAVDVRIAGGEGALVVEVVSRRPVGVGVTAEPLPGAGSGLIGLGERVALAGGELRHGPDPAGDFVLHATLPWTA